ncbi:putative dihydrofolate reductase-thymidylate synthase [Wickerhamomyces ciferrii]|uniref:Dihydrofolate reductase n=1 Tax=Wickerhamomyces ciferrii (strain ATCC 14091 / BCRC 22168 / CBS 111 / JCM 3599 / NBRC 0793 / NRRL Y-1031 F-60-10) TaxID=1206466 RepID=K0KX72_WICCF|nr:putative dihydrofolate reductase-thymidylate synthase [Wickerhamomyces ciferrii]CCH46642.1 putative dihydrofolate reductase-thymidylate synthase [Wickerhamomyces ciferrii]
MSSKQVSIIVAALLPSFGIGYKNQLPWKLRNEMKYFKNVTTNKSSSSSTNSKNAVIMGRKTWDSIPSKFRPLPDRYNVILTKQDPTSFEPIENVKYSNNIDDTIKNLLNDDSINQIFIIGGSEIYNNSITNNLVDNLLITEINHLKSNEIEMDTFLNKDYILNNFTKTNKIELQKFIGENIEIPSDKIIEGDFEYEFTLYKRK